MQAEELKDAFSCTNLKVKYNEPMSKHTYMRVGGPAWVFVEVETIQQLQDVFKLINDKKWKYFIIGAGSNILVSDSGYDGIVLKLKGNFNEVEFILQPVSEGENVLVKAGAGTMLSLLVKQSADFGCTGFEMLAGIPGTLGGALAGNSGTNNGTISDNLRKARIINTKAIPVDLDKGEIKFGYRSSSLSGQIIIYAEFILKKMNKEEVVKKITENLLSRSQTQPLGTFNAGSIFKNPVGNSAGKLIEECSFKGYKVGGAYVSDKHANFIINSGQATAADVMQVISDIQKKVKEKFGVSLEPEIKIV